MSHRSTRHDGNKIGAGNFGVVHKGTLKDKDKDKTPVAVKEILKGSMEKQIVKDSMEKQKDFTMELHAAGQTGHGNIVRLECWCCSRDGWDLPGFMCCCLRKQNFKLFLVYELVPNGSLHDHLDDKPDVLLPWTRRYKIVEGITSALHYLHHYCKPYILHRDIKPSNILLDDDFNAKLGDFGMSRITQVNRTLATIAIGTPEYMDPLCKKQGLVKFRPSSDIYSFGVVLLEIAHGENDLEAVRKMHTSQPDTFTEAIADKKLAGQFNRTQMERVIILGLLCSDQDENQRPSLIGALQFLHYGGELHPATPDATLLPG